MPVIQDPELSKAEREMLKKTRREINYLRARSTDRRVCRFIECYDDLPEERQKELALCIGRLEWEIKNIKGSRPVNFGTGASIHLLHQLIVTGVLP